VLSGRFKQTISCTDKTRALLKPFAIRDNREKLGSNMKKPVKAALVLALIALGFVWRPAWGLLIVFVLVEWAEDRWKELLGAIRGRRRSSSESKQEPDELQEEFEQQQEYERQIETAHQKNQFKHVHGLPWGDPASYVKASAPDDLEWAREHRKLQAEAVAGSERIL